jgi:hypothetical protein
VEGVDGLVLGDEGAGGAGVLVEHGAEQALAHVGNAIAHLQQGRGPLGRRVTLELAGDLGDGARVVGDALEVAVDTQDKREDAEVPGDRLLQREEAEARLLDRDFLIVDRVIPDLERVGDGAVETPEALDRFLQHADREGRLLGDAAAEGDELTVEDRP